MQLSDARRDELAHVTAGDGRHGRSASESAGSGSMAARRTRPGHQLSRGDVLWIDDEIGPNDALIVMLNNEGVEVECANSGANGLTKVLVQHRRYDGIILDVRLPDMSGLHVLEILAERHIRSPVLMLTGYPDLDGAVRAIKLGAWDYKPKTVLLDDAWIDVVKALVRQGRSDDHCDSYVWNVTSGRPGTHSGWAQTIANAVDAERQSPGLVTSVLAVAIADRALAPQVVLTCARAFRQAVTDGDQRVVSVLAASVIDACARVHQTQTPQSRASQILDTLERGLQNHRRLSASEIAGAVGTHPTSVGRWLRGDTGYRSTSGGVCWRLAPWHSACTRATNACLRSPMTLAMNIRTRPHANSARRSA